MSLVPYALRPRYVLRSFVVRKGLVHPNPLVRPLAMLMVGQGDFLRVKAIRHGLILGNPYWRAVGAMLLARGGQQACAEESTGAPRKGALRPGSFREGHRIGARTPPESTPASGRTQAARVRGLGERRVPSPVVKVLLRNPRREVEFTGSRSVNRLLDELQLSREAHLVICNGTLVPGDAVLGDDDQIEVRPVISGGAT